jgi:hypothetical protein
MMLVALSAFAQYPTTKNIKGTQVVIMTVPQAKAIDYKFEKLKDSIKLLNLSLYQNSETLRLTDESLSEANANLNKIQRSLNSTILINEAYLKEIERYKKMEFEDRKVNRRVVIGFTSAAVVWVFYIVAALTQK